MQFANNNFKISNHCGCGGIGRRNRFRFYRPCDVGVRVPSSVPQKFTNKSPIPKEENMPDELECNSVVEKEKIKAIKSAQAARIALVQILFAFQILNNKKEAENLLQDIISDNATNIYSKASSSIIDREYLNTTFEITLENLETIDSYIKTFMSKDWQIERLPKVVLAILRAGIAELMRKHLSPSIIINEYINIAKKMNHENEKAFIHSVLDKVAAKLSQ